MNAMTAGNEFIFNLVDFYFVPDLVQEALISTPSSPVVRPSLTKDRRWTINGIKEIASDDTESTNGPAEQSS